MNETLHFLETHGGMLITGATALLVVGGVALLLHRAPINRQRAGELTILTVMAWMLIACIPLPRFSTSELLPQTPAPTIARQIPHEVTIADPPVPAAIAQERLADEAARIHETAEILEQLAQLDAEQSVIPLVDSDLPLDDSQPRFDANVAVVAAPMIAPSSGAALAVDGFSWRQIVAAFYLGGAVLCVAWVVLGWLLLFRLTRQAISPHGWLQDLYTSLSSEPLPRLLVSSKCRRAFSCGWWRPTIVLPLECCEESRADQLRQILLHELAHLQQGDQRGRVLFNIALPLLYVHPLYWWIRSRSYLAAELVADDWAAGHSSTTAYAGELIALVKEQGRRGMAHVGTVGIFSSPTQFYRRMEMLVRRQTPLMTTCTRRWRLLTTLTAAVAVILLSSTLGVRLVQAEPDDGDQPAETAEAAPAAEASSEAVPAKSNQTPSKAKPVDESEGDSFGFSGRKRITKPAAEEYDPFADQTNREFGGEGNGLLRIGGGRGRNRMRKQGREKLLPALKALHRDVLIMRLQLINRRTTDKENEIRKLLMEKDATDAELVAQLYKNVLKRPANDAETALVQQIFKLSDNRNSSIQLVLQSIGELDNAMNATLTVLRLETQLDDVEAQIHATMEEATSLPVDLDSSADLTAKAGKTLKYAKYLKKDIASWHDLAVLVESNHNFLVGDVRKMKKEMAELAKLDKELQKQQGSSDVSRYWYGAPKTPSTTAPPDAGFSRYGRTQKTQPGDTPPKQRTHT
uniref:M56 family metallopeptidase n=1 Tax=Symmachiella dynata TaxID=2527995 RepID=UPI0030EECD33